MDTDHTPLTERSWLLQNKLNPFPVGGELSFDGHRLRFELGELAGEAMLGWVAERMNITKDLLQQRLRGGERIDAFVIESDHLEVSWPKIMGGAAMEVTDPQGRTWLIAMDYPSGGAITQTLNLISGRRKAKQWRAVLAH